MKNVVKKKHNELQNTIKATMKATLGGGELKNTVKLPDGEDENEWIAVNSCVSRCISLCFLHILFDHSLIHWSFFNFFVSPNKHHTLFILNHSPAVHFYNAANMIYGTCAEYCTEASCPVMSAGPKYEYLWKDGIKYKRPTRVSAPVYIDHLLNWYQVCSNVVFFN